MPDERIPVARRGIQTGRMAYGMTNSDRITVVGAGAMGSIFGCALADAGCDVSFLDISKNLVKRIRDRGLLLVRDGEEHLVRVRASDRALDIGISDVVLICVKCYDTEAAALGIGPLVGDDTIVVSLQNGWGNGEVLARFFDPVRLVVGVTYNSGTLLGPAHVAHTAEAPTYLGPYDGGGLEPAERFGAILARAGLSAHVTEQIRDEIWKKLV